VSIANPTAPPLPGMTPGQLWSRLRDRLGQGELGSLPVVLGLVIIWTVFQLANDRFLSAQNLTNLMLQITAMGMISVGIVLVLLLGEIDLSVGAVSGFAASVMAVLNVKNGMNPYIAILAGLGVGLAIGMFNGFFVTRFRVPSFVVTLAGLIGWQGALFYVLGGTGTVNLRAPEITGLANTFYRGSVGWAVAIVAVALYVGGILWARRTRTAAGLPVGGTASFVVRIVVVGAAVFGGMAVLNADRGLPLAVIIFVGSVVLFDLLTTKTRFGRSIYAVGGNAEAARRAGINVTRIRFTVFAIASTMAAAGGILGAARLLAVNQSSGSGNLLLNAIAAAVIGGTSLFGGRGTAWAALLGALVIGSISNGMDLLALSSSVKFMITGGVLLTAVTIDASARRARQAAGRA
jgi:D-xylose transport system permease protein